MKSTSSFYKIIFLFIIFFLPLDSLLAQNADSKELPKASITKELYIMFAQDVPEDAKIFEADITSLNLITLEEANRFFSFFNDASVKFDTNIITQKVKITLIPDAEKENWTLEEWSLFFKNKTAQLYNETGFVDFTNK
ncbi:hypothetical protein V9L05_02850 [Bernardetia sp. Wsw4-3y2]|uniref:hypothetical protein n=1 Tax=Bernardetia sp. Wsw4-3y2 TaxID=3127471 RepID=UPI0030CB9E04